MATASWKEVGSEEGRKVWDALDVDTRIPDTAKEVFEAAKEIIKTLSEKKEWVISAFGYTGFDVRAFRLKMVTDSNLEDIIFLIMIFLMRGNNVNRISKTTGNTHVVSKLDKLKTRLKIEPKAAGKTMVVTLSRIAISFPELVGLILSRMEDIPGAVSLEEMKVASGHDEFPSIARQPALSCFLPPNNSDTMLVLNAFLFSNMMVSEVINSSNESWQKKENAHKIAETKKYQLNAFNSALFTVDERYAWCETFGIMTGRKYKTSWLTAGQKSKEKLDSIYGSSF